MANFTNPHGGAYGLKDPFLHEELNLLIDQLLQAPNFDEGSSHAPTGDIALSGTFGHGFVFAEMFPFAGELDVSAGLTLDAPVSGAVIFGKLVAVDMRGPLSFKASPGGAPGSAAWESGASATWQSGSTLTLASGSTFNLSSAGYVRGQLTIKASGGPGSLVLENGTTNTCAGLLFVLSGGELRFQSGATETGTVTDSTTRTRTGLTTMSGDAARTAHRAVVQLTDADADLTVEADRYDLPATQAANRVYTILHTGVVPTIGQRVRVTRIPTSAPSAYTAKIAREDGTILFSFYNSKMGDSEFEYTAGGWKPIAGYQTDAVASGFYDL